MCGSHHSNSMMRGWEDEDDRIKDEISRSRYYCSSTPSVEKYTTIPGLLEEMEKLLGSGARANQVYITHLHNQVPREVEFIITHKN